MRPNRLTSSLFLALLAAVACRDIVSPDPDAPLQTDALKYEIRRIGPPGHETYETTTWIQYRFTNALPDTVFVENCLGDLPPGLQKLTNGTWVDFWGAFEPECGSSPIVIPPG